MRSMRWDNLKLDQEEGRRLPGYRDEAVVRRFTAPEAMGVNFYEVQAKSALNRVPEQSYVPFRWTINPYRGCTHACVFCFARPTHKYLDMNAGRDFEKEIVVKVNAPELVRAELAKPSWKFEHVALGTNTDPYQWVEARYRLMPGIWEAMRDFSNPCSILTKSPLLLRDVKLMQEISARAPFMASLSIPTIDEKVWRETEPHTPSPYARIEAVAELTKAGIATGVLVAPLMPGVNDSPAQVEKIIELCTEAGATHISGICLHLRADVKDLWFEWLEAYRPDLIPRYRELYGPGRGAYAKPPERERIAGLVQRGKRKAGFKPPPGETHEEAAGKGRPRDEAKQVRAGEVRRGTVRRWGGAPVEARAGAAEGPSAEQPALF